IELNRYALDGIVPNLIFFFKIDKETLVKRLNQKSIDNIELRGVDYLMKVQDYMQKVLDRLDLEYIEIDSQKSKDEIYREIVNNIKRRVDG
ncbi:MAG: dTMP kinase, partial [Epsilonproteobacteria bacterium]|nr:dTMP kinase [Campylobacterota bacterium]